MQRRYTLPARGQGPRTPAAHGGRQHARTPQPDGYRPLGHQDDWECGSLDCDAWLYPPDYPGANCPECGHPLVRPAREEF